jgi:deoxyribonuclease V
LTARARIETPASAHADPPLLTPATVERLLDAWPATTQQALAVQQSLRGRVVAADRLPAVVRHVIGVDVAYAEDDSRVFAAAVVLDAVTLLPLETQTAVQPPRFPYVPGLFAFRELPALLHALAQLRSSIDLIVCDGHGIAHPRRFGLASHLGVLLGLPCIGVAKTRLIGAQDEPAPQRGAVAPLVDAGEVVGAALRTRSRVKPVYVSIGHRVSLESALQWTLRLTPRYRLPESTRRADQAVNALRRRGGLAIGG